MAHAKEWIHFSSTAEISQILSKGKFTVDVMTRVPEDMTQTVLSVQEP